MILAKAGCSDEVIAAGILHDTVEDTPLTLDDIRKYFGDKVASMVNGCSEPDKSLPWEDRKRHTVEFLKTAPLEVRLVACADKLHNIRTIASEYQRIGDEVWANFKRGGKDQEWYYRALVDSLCDGSDDQGNVSLFQAFRREVESLFGKD
jgi:(p)ppGpp synthase/HD superfamily hydrolase